MADNFTPVPANEIIEDPKVRRMVYKIVGYAGLVLLIVTAALAAFGVLPETNPYLLAAWSVFGIVQKWSFFLADKNVPIPKPVET